MAERFRVVPMEPAHYAEAAGDLFPWQDATKAAETLMQFGPAFAGFVDDHLAAVAGVTCAWPGRGDAWAVLTAVGRQHPGFVHRHVVRGLRRICEEYRLERVTADVIGDFYVARGWVLRMGFRKESTMRRYGPQGVDMVRYRLLTHVPAEVPA